MALDRFYSLGCFASGEVTGYTPQPVQSVEHHQPIVDPTAESKSNLDELLRTTSAESREGRKILERAVGEEVQKTVREVFSQFHAEAIREFGQAFTESDIAAIIRVMKLHNLPQTGKAFSQARYLAASAGYISEKFLNADEKLALELDRLDRPMTFEEKRAFNRKVAALHKGTPLLG